jgi:hypothetical protein
VTSDCLIAYSGNRYSVPCLYAGQEVWVRTSQGIRLLAFSKAGKLIATHTLKAGRGHVIIQKEHYRGYIRSKDRESFFITAERLKERFQSYERMEEFLLGAKAQKRINPDYNLYMIRRLFEDYADQDCVMAMQECFRYNCFSYAFIKGFLTANARVMVDLKPSARWHELSLPPTELKRDLKEYSL